MNTEEQKKKHRDYMREYYKTYKETDAFKEHMAKTRDDRNAKARVRAKKRYDAKADELRAQSRDYYHTRKETPAGREMLAATRKKWKNSELGKATEKKWRETPKGRAVSQAVWERRRAALHDAVNTLTTAEWREIIESYSGLCVYCNKKCDKPTQDHIIPLSAGGSHTKENVVPACKSCNPSKGNKPLLYWMSQKIGYAT